MPDHTIHLCTVSFRDATLYVLERGSTPYVPLRPIVEGMGLTWQSQHEKLKNNRQRFRVTNIVTQMPGDDQRRKVCCIPINKLSGWLMSINANKVKPELRALITDYQAECDEVLWTHWRQRKVIPEPYDDAYDHYTLAASRFEETAAFFHAIASLSSEEVQVLAQLGWSHSDDCRTFYQDQAEALLH